MLKDMADATGIVAAAESGRRAVVLGAGVLGVEVATGLARRGIAVRVVHLADRLMERHRLGGPRRWWSPCPRAARHQHPRRGVGRGGSTRRGRLEGVRFGDGLEAAADLFRHAHGHRAGDRAAPWGRADLRSRGGRRRIDPRCPDDPNVYAIGDCAQPPTGATGLVAQGLEQASRLVARLTDGGGSATDGGTHDVVRVKASGMSMVSMGVCGDFDRDDPRYRVLSLKDPERGRYAEVVVSAGHLVGATRLGDADVAATLSALYTCLLPVPDRPGAAAGAGARRRRHGIRREAPRVFGRRRAGVHLQLRVGRTNPACRARGCASVADVGCRDPREHRLR